MKSNIIDMLTPTCSALVFVEFLEGASCSPNDPKNQMRSVKEIKDYQYFHFFCEYLKFWIYKNKTWHKYDSMYYLIITYLEYICHDIFYKRLKNLFDLLVVIINSSWWGRKNSIQYINLKLIVDIDITKSELDGWS